MTFIPILLRDVPASVSGFPVPRVGCCCFAPYHQNSRPLAPVRRESFIDIDVDQKNIIYNAEDKAWLLAELKKIGALDK